MKNPISAILLADESVRPTQKSIPLHQMSLNGKKVLEHSSCLLLKHCQNLVVVATNGDCGMKMDRVHQELVSIYSKLEPQQADTMSVIIHDALNPYLTEDNIRSILGKLREGARVVASAVPVPSLLAKGDHLVIDSTLKAIQPPFGFDLKTLLEAHEWRKRNTVTCRDNITLTWKWGSICPVLVQGSEFRPRLANSNDLFIAEGVLKFSRNWQLIAEEESRGLRNCSVLVLGGSGGIGSACVQLLAKLGARCDAPSRQELDLSERVEFKNLDQYDMVIHAAGAYRESSRYVMAVNFHSCADLIDAAELSKWRGKIVFISSSAATFGRQDLPVYSGTKAALNSLIEAKAENLAKKGILVNAVAPARVNTRLQRWLKPSASGSEMLDPQCVAAWIVRLICTCEFGKIVPLRNGVDYCQIQDLDDLSRVEIRKSERAKAQLLQR